MLDRHGIIMTTGIYANATGDTRQAELQRTIVQTLARQEHVQQVHGFYCYDDGNRVSVDVVPDLTVTDDQAFTQNLLERLKQVLPDQQVSILIDHNYAD